MLNQKVLEYVDDVISRIAAPEEVKVMLGNQLIRHFLVASEYTSINEIMNELDSPEKLAEEISNKLINEMSKGMNSIFTEPDKQNVNNLAERTYGEYVPMYSFDGHRPPHPPQPHPPQKYNGEYTFQESDVNIKLLYIPLIQISAGVVKIHQLLMDDGPYHI
ncbi:MAG: hypothetical protein ABFD08_09740 [Syntrophomonas sp.]